MKTHIQRPKQESHAIQSKAKASNQAPVEQILQRYKEKTIQRENLPNEDELLQGKFETVQREESDEEELLQGKFETIQRKEMDEDELLQGRFDKTAQLMDFDEEEPLQQKSIPTTSVQRKEYTNRTGLPDNLKSGIENLSGYSMDDVRVHYNSDKPAQLQALAYTQGSDIHVAPGQEKHLPHEAWHVVQQKQGRVQPTMQLQGVNVNDNEGLEKEADVMGEGALQAKSINTVLSENNINQNRIVQAYGFVKIPTKGNRLYQISDNRNIIVGLGTPNHELYMYNPEMINQIQSPNLNFNTVKDSDIKNYYKVIASYKKEYLKEKKTGELKKKMKKHIGKRSPKTKSIKIDITQMALCITTIRGLMGQIEKLTIFHSLIGESPLLDKVKDFFTSINVNMDNSQLNNFDVINITNKYISLIYGVSGYLDTDKQLVIYKEIDELSGFLYNELMKLNNMLYDLKTPINMLLLQQIAYNYDLYEYLDKEDAFITYRACDVMAGLVDSKGGCYNYDAEGFGHHYAKVILKDGEDSVTMESFAANKIEGLRIGKTDKNKDTFITLDNSWQYLMYGGLKNFEDYTYNRYKFKGFDKKGKAGKVNPMPGGSILNKEEFDRL